ncbi:MULTISPECIES: 50S ribosomal protein L25/general stress protein Ctc [Enterococcaceae]|uniref:50S ribosomal protein L25/general stress protein Ctc n=1 Tax=Enterococcaceae TaxID=81852 RepID=UPI000E4A7BC0|nr:MULTISPECIES: 50S ribosomal protein L25/general stress protein Ctc [Enterococcaceae]MCI0130195.1 50S ribosomal protein L25/general stress protein Ctc [Vagococcus sp. CY53-2]RGI31055.1 50S ribosomal protein L25/general stress protein Ctc [Melissococcus sp. OM08-11BH]UNM89017.1 50S ribosomal protein L25/general stress protein Ctc [Vagococcus sp. CY52-2]
MSVVLKVEERATRPRSIRRKLREEGRVPGAVNGNGIQNLSISVDARQLEKDIRENGLNAVYVLELDGKKISTLLHTYELDTFTKSWIHVEFLAVDMSQETEVEAELSLVGTSKGVKSGGILEQNLYSVIVSATPDKLPERVEVNIEDLEIGDSLVVADIPKHDEFTIITDAEEQICAVVEMAAPVEDEANDIVAEPELVNAKPEEA